MCSMTVDGRTVRLMSEDAPLSEEGFQSFLDQFGPREQHWPESRALEAKELLARSAMAREMLQQALLIIEAVRSNAPTAPAGLADRIFKAAFAADPPTSGLRSALMSGDGGGGGGSDHK